MSPEVPAGAVMAVSPLLGICERLGATAASIAIRESAWTYPIINSAHVLSLAVFVGLVVILDLRLIGVAMRATPVTEVQRGLWPWTIGGFVLMAITGALLFYSDPVRFYGNVFFWIKIGLMALAGVNAFVFHNSVFRRVADWDQSARTPARARIAGALSLLLWAAIIVAGRLIAYNWFS
jgi:hypothetical protein